ncbi:hypothetical protein K438DRAFT_1786365 [Mycena galopus ATCC 62051]|nr:hypothetical protein K438DRAFT_1786365 [Mycena galopus ATCC 62051]
MPLLHTASSAAVAAAMLPMCTALSAAEQLLGCPPSFLRLRLIHLLTTGINVALARQLFYITSQHRKPGLHAGEGSNKEKADSGDKATVPCWSRTYVANWGIFISPDTKGAQTQSQSDDGGVWMGSVLDKDDVQLGSGFNKADPRVVLDANKDAGDQA